MPWRSLLARETNRPLRTTPGFGQRVTLKEGDRIVRRDVSGQIEVLRVTGERTVETVTRAEKSAA